MKIHFFHYWTKWEKTGKEGNAISVGIYERKIDEGKWIEQQRECKICGTIQIKRVQSKWEYVK